MEMQQPQGLRWMVCHDGSQASIDALNTVHKGLLREHDLLDVANIWNQEKEAAGVKL